LNQRKFSEAIDYFSLIQPSSSQFAEAAFYTGLIQWQQKNYEQALAVLRPLAEDLKLTSVYNTLGAIAVQASIAERKNKGKSDALLKEGLELLKKASESAPDETASRFNYAFARFLNNDYKEAAAQLRPILAASPRDGEAYFLLAKALEKTGEQTTAADFDNQARRFLVENNRYAKLERSWKNGSVDDVNLRVQQTPRKDFVSVVLVKKQATPNAAPLNETETLLAQARTLYKNGGDDEAMAVLRRVLASEPMSAEAYLLLGNIHLRRGDLEQAISSLKTALFWDNKLIMAHVGLGKIYLQRGDCLQAKNYTSSALAVDAENQDALGLQRQVERCSK
jgi:tetratricopeptide (TPR) repeat protein